MKDFFMFDMRDIRIYVILGKLKNGFWEWIKENIWLEKKEL